MLTRKQHDRLEKMPEDAKVVGFDRNCPLVERDGRVVRVLENGSVAVIPHAVRDEIADRRAGVKFERGSYVRSR